MRDRDPRAGDVPGEDLVDVDQGTLRHASRRLVRRSRVSLDATQPILVRDAEGRVSDLDNQAIRSLGWRREELLGRPFEEAFAPEWREALEALVERCRAGEEIREAEGVLWTRQQERIPVLLSLSRVLDEAVASPAIAARARHVGGRKAAEGQSQGAAAAIDRAKQDEQRNLGSALHDTIGQLLPLARMKLAELLDELPESLRGQLEQVDRLLADAELRARTLMFRLSPAVLHDIGIAAAAYQLSDEMHEHYGLRVSVVDSGRRMPLDEARRTALFRGLRELLINVARHADVDAATVRIDRDDDRVWVRIEDEGRGFDPSVRGFGLRSVAERLERVGGCLEVESSPGQGSRFRMAVPAFPATPSPEDAG